MQAYAAVPARLLIVIQPCGDGGRHGMKVDSGTSAPIFTFPDSDSEQPCHSE